MEGGLDCGSLWMEGAGWMAGWRGLAGWNSLVLVSGSCFLRTVTCELSPDVKGLDC